MGIAKTLAGAYAKTGDINTGDVMKKGQSGELFQDTSGAATINTDNIEPPVRPVEPPVDPNSGDPHSHLKMVDENIDAATEYEKMPIWLTQKDEVTWALIKETLMWFMLMTLLI